ncbi:apoptosis regulatory protein Siva-like isoform X2 [Antedon mediterranea]|uniref:apoptosis regulatory protein Siva-like isoform X2 n=1 Tax=Antedon mediterranea TaxID=105859 RepID=UPI003AF86F45
MPKRARTEEEYGYCPLQLKTHVGIKEVNMGVNSEKNMKAVYAHTMNLMLQGQKAYYTGGGQTNNNNYGHGCSDGHPHRDSVGLQHVQPGQLQLNMTGQLGLNKPEGEAVACGGQVEASCRACLTGSDLRALNKCIHCEHSMCRPCSRQCDNCCGTYCQFCTVLNYDERHERIFCLSCLPLR